MHLSPQGLDLLIAREALRTEAYLDTADPPVWTIGVGHTGPEVCKGLMWSVEKCREVFARDIARFEIAVNDSVTVPMEQYQFDALVSFAFNIGTVGVMNSWVVRELNAGNLDGAAAAFDNWHKPPSIISRRNAEREQFRGEAFEARIGGQS